jgi:hypothetical protein
MRVQSALGQPFRSQIMLIGGDSANAESGCFKALLSSIDGGSLGPVRVSIKNDGTTSTVFLSGQTVNEPAATLELAYNCAPQARRDYPLLLDPPLNVSAPLVAPTRPVALPFPNAGPQSHASSHFQNDDGDVAAPPKRRHRAAPSQTMAVDENIQPQTLTPSPAKEPRARKSAAKTSKNVLRLGSGDALNNLTSDGEMRLSLSYSLSAGASADVPVALPNAEASAQPVAGSAAAAVPVDPQLQALQEKILLLETKTEDLRKLNATQLTALTVAKKDQDSKGSLLYLYYFLLLCVVAAIGWLIWRMRQLRSELNHSSWRDFVPEAEPDSDELHRQQADIDDIRTADQGKRFAAHNVAAPAAPAMQKSPTGVTAGTPVKKDIAAAKLDDVHENDYQFISKLRSDLTNAEEILDEIQQAEFWMYMNQPERAIEILENNDHGNRPTSPLPWLYLFDLYRTVGNREKYESLSARFKGVFNCRAAAWDDKTQADSRSLEDFPVVMNRIIELWPTEELVPFLEDILIDDRDGARQGFDLAAYRELLFLTNIAYKIQPAKKFSDAPFRVADWEITK